MKQKLKPYILRFFDAPIEENKASVELKMVRKIVKAAKLLVKDTGFSSTLNFDLYKATGKTEYNSSCHINDHWIEDSEVCELVANLKEAIIDYNEMKNDRD